VQKKCTSVLSNSFNAPRINSYLTMSTYQYVFGLEDERLEDLIMDKVPLVENGHFATGPYD